jgi:hypothetical protein
LSSRPFKRSALFKELIFIEDCEVGPAFDWYFPLRTRTKKIFFQEQKKELFINLKFNRKVKKKSIDPISISEVLKWQERG